jgi:hypothetical protein
MTDNGSLSGKSTLDILKGTPIKIGGDVSITAPTNDQLAGLANLREVFFTRDILNTIAILKADLQKYIDGGDISRMKMVVLDELIPSFLKKICNVYDTPPLFKFADDVDKAVVEAFGELAKEVQLNRFMPETLERSRFHNTVIVYVRYFKELDKLYVENAWHAGNCEIETYDGYDLEMRKFSYIQSGEGDTQWRVFWELLELNEDGSAKTLHYKVKLKKNGGMPDDIENSRVPIGDNSDIVGPPYWPLIAFRYSERGRGFWGNAMDSLVELVRAINILLTVTNDDTIQETIRILLLNFNPIGTEGDEGQLKTGLRHPLFPDDQLGKDKMDAKILTAELFNDDVMKLIEGLWSVVANTHNVGNVLKPDFKQAVSSLALRIEQQPLLRDWEHDINVVTPLDMQLVQTLIQVNNYHRPDKKINVKAGDKLLIEYQEPNLVTDEQGEYDLEKSKWDDGTSSPLLFVMRANPEMSEADAKKYITDNLKTTGELLGVTNIEVDEKDPDKIIND